MTPAQLKQHMNAIYSRCYRLLGDEDLAWDVLQEVMMRFYEASGRQSIEKPLHYLYRSCTNHCIKAMRRHKRMVFLPMEELTRQGGHQTQAIDEKIQVEQWLQWLEQDEFQLLLYRHVDQMTYGEIAALVGYSDRGIKKKLERIERRVRGLMKKDLP